MDQLFIQILKMSMTASYAILFVIVARLLLKKAPRFFSYVLWSVVLFRLICPISIESMFSFLPVSAGSGAQNIMNSETLNMNSGIAMIDQVVNHSLPAPAVGVSVNPIQIWIFIGAIVWLTGIIILLLYSIFTTFKLTNRLKSASVLVDNIYETNSIKTPFVYGIMSPKIYLPIGLSETEKSYIIKHEKTHIKRFDHVIKFLSFIVLSIHWFNPLVWIAFFLMSKDMECSCDEAVIKEMGYGIKKDYSNSLLSLAVGRRTVGSSPLAFSEDNPKERIKNILNYKKPKFWVVGVAIVAVIAIAIGLMANPVKQQLTIEDYANQFMKEQITYLESFESTEYKIVESKITTLERVGSFDNFFNYPVEIWLLEYRLKPDDMSKVMLAGGMNEIDGWLTEEASMGKPMLIFSNETRGPKYLGYIRHGEIEIDTIAGQETALRAFLEGKGLLPRETYAGNHVVVKFPLSTGETSQVLLSQPVIQGEEGIWCPERWMDGNGNVYYITPNTDGLISDYYQELQNDYDNGEKIGLGEPLRVALDWINNDLGQHVFLDELSPQYSATINDFMETPESYFIGYISNFRVDEPRPSFHLDLIEWLTRDDVDRLKEIGLTPDELPNGFYIHNPDHYPMYHQVTEKTEYHIIDWGESIAHKNVTIEEFVKSMEKYETTPPYRVITKDGYVKSITEQYIP
ncbi:MAG: M56 family metallopeptidase [Peptostreptococcales bacterium]